ncbi:glycoside hydrolase family 88 protein [Paenibacillus oryzisoli]|uniref:glycoside hydrolase family 88 protein n=1 Tax=Paenibacillus oryzisoli TaxID=1850517 RepID=UPI003D29894F
MDTVYENALRDMDMKIYRNCLLYNGDIPFAVGSLDGTYTLSGKGQWTDGFWPGLQLLAYAGLQDDLLLGEYERYMPFLIERVNNDPTVNKDRGYLSLDHDVGFIFHLTAVYHYVLTGSQSSREIGLKAAESLLGRFQEKGSYIRAWNNWESDTPEFRQEKKGKAIIDSLMNVPLLFWAAKETGESRYRKSAEAHIRQLATNIVREDGSTYHSYNFNPDTGNPVGGRSVQGYSHASTWSRGQAWAIYGFALAYRYTGNEEFLQASQRCLNYWKHSLLPEGDAPWDFAAPRNKWLPIDTSAMSIASCGILELYLHAPDDRELHELAERMISRLLEAHRAPAFPAGNAFLLHGCVGPAYREGSKEEKDRNYFYANQSLIYGDYFLYEAIMRLQSRNTLLPWDF